MQTRRTIWISFLALMLAAVIVLVIGASITLLATTEPATPAVWGKGELPADHQEYFGNDNASRLNYVQNRVLNKHDAIIKEIARRVLILEAVDPNAIESHTHTNQEVIEILEEVVLTDCLGRTNVDAGMEKLTLVEPVE